MHPYKLALAASTALMASMSASLAAVIAQTVSFSSKTDWGTLPQTTNFSPTKSLSFSGFNPSLGTLTSIKVGIYDSLNGSVNLKNNGTSATNVSGSLLNTLRYILPAGSTKSLLSQSQQYKNSSLAANATSGAHAVTGKTTAFAFPTNLSSFDKAWDIVVGDLGQVVVGSGNGNGSATYTDTGAVKIVADYSYTPAPPPPPSPPPPPPVTTPEPGTLTILGAGLAGLGLLRRRRKST